MKILLIFPPLTKSAFAPVYETTSTGVGSYPPLGLLYLAAYLEKYSAHNVKVLDCAVDNIDYLQLSDYIKKENPQIAGIYSCTNYWWDAVNTARLIKKIDKNIVTMFGGPHVFIYPKETINFPEIDYVVYGEGEFVSKELLDRLEKGYPCEDIAGVITKSNQNNQAIFQLQKISDLDSLPFPARHLTPYKKYSSILAIKNPIATLMTSRGCPYNCYFCASDKIRKPRMRTPKNVVDELSACVKMGVHNFIFFDELFTFPAGRAMQICDEIIHRQLKIHWQIRSRADTLDTNLTKKLKQAGCNLIQFGIESGSPHIQKVLNKNLNLDKVRQVMKMVKSEGLLIYGDFLLGSPEETEEEIFQTVKFSKDLNLDYAIFSPTQILPGTELYKRAMAERLIDSDYWREYALNPEKPLKRIYWMGEYEEVDKLARKCYKSFYLNPKYILGSLGRIKSFKQLLWQLTGAVKTFLFS